MPCEMLSSRYSNEGMPETPPKRREGASLSLRRDDVRAHQGLYVSWIATTPGGDQANEAADSNVARDRTLGTREREREATQRKPSGRLGKTRFLRGERRSDAKGRSRDSKR